MSRIIPLYHHGKSVDEIVKETGHSVGTVLRIVGHWEEINSYQYLKTIHGPEKPVQPAERLMIQGNTEVAANLNEETSIEQTGNEEKGPNSEEGLSGLEGQNSEKVSLESECINVEEEIVEIVSICEHQHF